MKRRLGPLIFLLALYGCSSQAVGTLPSGTLLVERAPDFRTIESFRADETAGWGDENWTRARVSPNGDFVIAYDSDDVLQLLDTDGQKLAAIGLRVICPSFRSNSEIMAFSPADADGSASLQTWTISREDEQFQISETVSAEPFADFPTCPVAIGESIAHSVGAGEVSTDVVVDGQPIPSGFDDDCVVLPYASGPDEQTLPLLVRCDDAEDSGLFALDLPSSEFSHLVDGFVGAPHFSESLLFFGRVRGECCEPIDVWFADEDGDNQQLVLEDASFPIFLPEDPNP